METRQNVLKTLLQDFSAKHTVTSLSKASGMSRVGVWKVLKKLEAKKLVVLAPIGIGKTSAYSVSLNWNNVLTERGLELLLMEEAHKGERWLANFAELGKKAGFLVLFGSVLYSQRDANDIDILVVASKKRFLEINMIVSRIQRTQIKKVHATNLTESELKEELLKHNKALLDAIKKGVVLFGQEKFIQFVRRLSSR